MNVYPEVVVIGAGPVGLAAAAELLERGLQPVVFEAGETAGAAVRQWHHVRLFSRWSELVAPAARRLLAETGWQEPDADGYPTGRQWAELYLEPLARALGSRVHLRTRVTGVARRGRDRVVDAGRDTEPLTVRTTSADGVEHNTLARAVIDASGTWGSPNPLGGDGLPAIGETGIGAIGYRVPDLSDPQAYAGKRIVVVGSGHSALTALVAFADFARQHAGTRLTWAVRRQAVATAFGGGAADQLAARGALGQHAREAVETGEVEVVTGFRTARVDRDGDALVLVGDDDRRLVADRVVALTGFRPDLSWLSEVRLDLDARLQAPVALAPLIDPNVHSCGTVYPHGVKELAHPEPGMYVVGMKSYGRAPTFLALTGYEQVRSVAAAIAGDADAAGRVELTLPETGVCGGSGLFDGPAAATCCGPVEARKP
ncbi:FAD-dependent oxidoreductase [Fodinicola acaciae]|uniref:FAD-dependent oxidoreductase n=1 Tax=Fodinicola acaciae TaxID=2681555 RepID=UPI0013D369DC|nr:FAD-dependent oxidoreductase [Fodinicola acaciae]